MALAQIVKNRWPNFICASCATHQRRLAAPGLKGRERACPKRVMLLEPLDSNEHSIRFKVLEEVELVAVVEHILANAAADAHSPREELLSGRARALELLQLGAVYVGIPQKGLDHINWVRSLELTVAPTAATVPAGNYVRVHPRPKRYPACYCSDWPSRVLFCDEEYVVVNKPAGLPCMRHESNALEELASCVGRALGMNGLEVCHRLDQWTTGIVVLSRTKEANKAFKRSLQDREAGLIKTYKALSHSPVPLGPLEHHMYDGPFNEGAPVLGGGNLRPRGPRLLSRTAHNRWRVCKLDVKECREHAGALAWYQRYFAGDLQDATLCSETSAYSISLRNHQQQDLDEEQDSDKNILQEASSFPSSLEASQQSRQKQPRQQAEPQYRLQLNGSMNLTAPYAPEEQANESGMISKRPASTRSTPATSAAASTVAAMASASMSMEERPFARMRLYESTIDLHTGRTHQIRAQLASILCPLVGDVMYAPIAGYLVGESGVVDDPEMVSLVEQLPMLDRHIGLHAWRLSWRGRTFTAPPEWGDN